jgi:enoyl-CoA hydratase/carnithine racemase
MSAELKAARYHGTLILTLSNPGLRNTLHPDMYAAAIETLSTAERDDSVRVVVLTGADHFFCGGGDLHRLLEYRSRSAGDQADTIDNLHRWIDMLRDCPKPVIAAVDGAAVGAGFSLALACDLIVAGTGAKFSMPQVRVGLTPDGGGSWLLTQALPRQLATEMMIEGKPVLATRLFELGIVNRLVADGTALDNALGWALELASLSENTIEQTKSLLGEADRNSLAENFDAGKKTFLQTISHPDSQEGIEAFLDKRLPIYNL